ncbi:MAG: type II toxin-antitoxin system VapC family toxin [Chloroflexi bacterium]|nr:type II toxin-antitoxin system VapC family toxin [Chloroflexota bacterium]
MEEDSDRARATLATWRRQGARLAAPYFMVAEVANALHRRVHESTLDADEASSLMDDLLSPELRLELHAPPGIHQRGMALARQLRQPAVYDCIYLALAEALDGELWTADERFYRAASLQFSNVRWLGEADVLN